MALGFGDHPAELYGALRLRLRAILSYDIIEEERWQVHTPGYRYELLLPSEEVLFAFHWHPLAEGGITFPHLYIGSPWHQGRYHLRSRVASSKELAKHTGQPAT